MADTDIQRLLGLFMGELDGSYSGVVAFFQGGLHLGLPEDAVTCPIANYIRGRFASVLSRRQYRDLQVQVTNSFVRVELGNSSAHHGLSPTLRDFVRAVDAGIIPELKGQPQYAVIPSPSLPVEVREQKLVHA